ncbi:MAG: hypothetical protein ACRCR4_11630 [Thiotrichaceae bacterium]
MNKPLPNKADKAVQYEHEWLYVKDKAQKLAPVIQSQRRLSRFFNIIGRGLQCQWLNP